jgi:hypothetical protein
VSLAQEFLDASQDLSFVFGQLSATEVVINSRRIQMAKSKKVASKKVAQAEAPVEITSAPMPVAATAAEAPAPAPRAQALTAWPTKAVIALLRSRPRWHCGMARRGLRFQLRLKSILRTGQPYAKLHNVNLRRRAR